MEENKKLIKVVGTKGIKILDEELLENIKMKKLSPSMISSFLQCPADWLLNKFIMDKIEHEEQPFFARGRLFHSVMEKFFALENNERNSSALGEACKQTLNEEEWAQYLNDKETKLWLLNAVKNYIEMKFDYKNETVATLKSTGKPGLECFISGKIGNAEREIVGFIDKVIQGKHGLIVEDWKTGKKIHPYDQNQPISDKNSFDYFRQQTIYSMLLEQQGEIIEAARLIFPVAKGIVDVDFKSLIVRNQVIEDIEKVDKELTKCIEENLFPFYNHMFCGWCGELNSNYRGRKQQLKVNKMQLYAITEFEE